jgi:hypothetical protein
VSPPEDPDDNDPNVPNAPEPVDADNDGLSPPEDPDDNDPNVPQSSQPPAPGTPAAGTTGSTRGRPPGGNG